MIARRIDLPPPRPPEPTIAQRLAEELVTDLVRRSVDVISLLELERDVAEAVSGIAEEMGAVAGAAGVVPAAALAAVLIDQAFRKVEAEWRLQRTLCEGDECIACAAEVMRQPRRARDGGGRS